MPDDQPSNGPRVPIGFMIAGSEMASFALLGLLLDYALGTMPGFTIGLTLMGTAVAFYQLVRMSKALTGKKSEPPGGGTGGGP
jgi:F0F1-type ATP synthase assembly protein I